MDSWNDNFQRNLKLCFRMTVFATNYKIICNTCNDSLQRNLKLCVIDGFIEWRFTTKYKTIYNIWIHRMTINNQM